MNVAMAKLSEIMGGIGLSLSAEKTRTVEAETGFEFLGFRFVRHYSRRRTKRVTRWFPSGKSKRRIFERIGQLTDKSNLSMETPYEARDAVMATLRGWGEYFRRSMASEVFDEVWGYADACLGRMERRWHQRRYIGRLGDRARAGLSVLQTRITPIPYAAYNAAR
jgi:group II intron maturase